MKKILLFIITASIFTFSSCYQKEQKQGKEQVSDTIPMMVMQIQKCNRLYTAEAHVHKIITHDDQLNLKGSFFRKNFNIHVTGSNRKVAIPMNATIKASVDFQGLSNQNVLRKGDKIEIILPDPKLTLTSSKIDHNAVKQYVSIARSNFSDAELTQLEQQGRQSIINDIPNLDLMEQARLSHANTLSPMLKKMGFKEEKIKSSFRKRFTNHDLNEFITNGLNDNKTKEKRTASSQASNKED